MKLPTLRQALGGLIVLFLVFAVLNDPTQSASVTANVWDQLKDGFGSITTFFDALMEN